MSMSVRCHWRIAGRFGLNSWRVPFNMLGRVKEGLQSFWQSAATSNKERTAMIGSNSSLFKWPISNYYKLQQVLALD
jgi:hypothetical protein